MSGTPKYRLVTRSDFDGLVCALLLQELDLIDDILFVHPKDMQDGKIPITDRDITTNLPYADGVYLAFDHHMSEAIRNDVIRENHIIDPYAPSAARVVYNYYGGLEVFPHVDLDLLDAVDQADTADFTRSEILEPTGWVLLGFITDPRTGLGRYRDFRISNYQLMLDLVGYCKNLPVEEILQLSDVRERCELYFEQQERFQKQLQRCAKVYRNLVVLDLRGEEEIHVGTRFMVYALFPECNISIHVVWGLKQRNTVFAVGKSILNRTSKTVIGPLMLKYGGGGHGSAGTCQIPNDRAPAVLEELIEIITTAG